MPVSNQKRTTATPRSNRPLLSAPIFKSRLRAAHLWDLGSGEGPRFLEGRGGALVATWCPPGIRLAAGWLATGRGCDYASKVGVYLNLKFWCVGGAAVVVPWLVRGIPAVQSGCGSGVGRVRPWCFPDQNLSAKLDKPAGPSPVSRPPLAWHAPSHYQPNASREKELGFTVS